MLGVRQFNSSQFLSFNIIKDFEVAIYDIFCVSEQTCISSFYTYMYICLNVEVSFVREFFFITSVSK